MIVEMTILFSGNIAAKASVKCEHLARFSMSLGADLRRDGDSESYLIAPLDL